MSSDFWNIRIQVAKVKFFVRSYLGHMLVEANLRSRLYINGLKFPHSLKQFNLLQAHWLLLMPILFLTRAKTTGMLLFRNISPAKPTPLFLLIVIMLTLQEDGLMPWELFFQFIDFENTGLLLCSIHGIAMISSRTRGFFSVPIPNSNVVHEKHDWIVPATLTFPLRCRL